MSQHRLELLFYEIRCNGMMIFMEFMTDLVVNAKFCIFLSATDQTNIWNETGKLC